MTAAVCRNGVATGAIFFIAPDGGVMGADVEAGTAFRTTPPRRLFATNLAAVTGNRLYAVSQNGQRFLIRAPEQTINDSLTVVLKMHECASR